MQVTQFDWEQIIVPIGKFCGLVVGNAIRLDLLLREVFGNVDWKLF